MLGRPFTFTCSGGGGLHPYFPPSPKGSQRQLGKKFPDVVGRPAGQVTRQKVGELEKKERKVAQLMAWPRAGCVRH